MKIKDKVKDALLWFMLTASFLLLVYHTVRPNKANNSVAPDRVEIKTGTTISQLEFKRPNGEDFAIPQKGKYLVAFLTIGCEPCRQQMPKLNELAKTNSYDGVIGIFFEPMKEVKEFELSNKLDFICLIDYKSSARSFLNLNSFPYTTEVIDGIVTRNWMGLHKTLNE